MLRTMLNILIPAIGTAAVMLLLCLPLGYSFKKSRTWGFVAAILLFAADVSAAFLIKNEQDAMLASEIILAAGAMIIPTVMLEHRKRTTLVWFGFIFCSTFDYLESLILSFIKEERALTEQIIYLLLYIAAVLAVLGVYFFLHPKVPSEFLENLPPAICIVIFFADYSAYYDMMISRDSSYYVEFSNILKLVSAALIVGSFSYIVYKYTSLSYKEKEAELRLESELRHYEEMIAKNRDIRAFRHDYKNNLFSINAFIKSGRLHEAEEYIKELDDALSATENAYSTGSYLADAIISDKARAAREKGIEIDFSGTIPAKGIKNSDLCAVISNAVDNAIRGCEECAPCKIIIISEEKSSGVLMTFKNPVKEKVVIKNNSIRTTKQDKNNHGIGLGNIRRAAKKYNGYVQLECDDRFFTLEVGMMYNS